VGGEHVRLIILELEGGSDWHLDDLGQYPGGGAV